VSDDSSPIENLLARFSQGGGKKLPPAGSGGPGGGGDDGGDEEDDGMLRMSFLDHLGELRSRIIRALVGFGVVFLVCLVFSNQLWLIVQAPAVEAFRRLTVSAQQSDEERVKEVCKPPSAQPSAPCQEAMKAANTPKVSGALIGIDPMEQFSILWMWTPLVASIFLGSPWILYQIWAFIAPGLYKSERKWAVPFVLTTAGLFLTGGFFAYFIAFRYGLTFLLGLGGFAGIRPLISIDKYFELFVDVMLGVSAIFEMPIIIFFLVLLRLASPKFLLEHSRYAILAIVIIAAIITPTPDVFNLMLFAVPMCLLFFVGVFAGYLLVLHREGKGFPWAKVMPWFLALLVILALIVWIMIARYHYHLVNHLPFLTK